MTENLVTIDKISFKNIPQLVKMHHDPSIYTFDPDTVKVINEEIARKYIQKAHKTWKEGTTYIFSVYNQNKEFVGFITLRNIVKNSHAKIGFAITKDHRRKGYVTAAIQKIIEYAKDVLELKVVEASVHKDNIRSQKALIKNGFLRIDRKNCIGKFKKDLNYEILQIKIELPRK